MDSIFLNDFSEHDKDDVLSEYRTTDEERAFVKQIILADYTYEDYSGNSYVLFVGVDDKLYEVYGSHCSCHGLEDQWDIEETTLEYFYDQIERGNNTVNGVPINQIVELIKLTIN